MSKRIVVLALLLGGTAQIAAAAIIPAGPAYPPPGGVTFGSAGTNPGDAGGFTYIFTGFDVSGLANLWYGVDLTYPPAAALDGSLDAMTFSGVSGSTATWDGTTDWDDPSVAGGGTVSVPTRLELTVSGGPSWVTLPIPGYTFPAIGAVIDNSAGSDFSLNFIFTADTGGGGYVPINTIQQVPPGGQTLTSVGFGFYSVVPEPSSIAMAGLGLLAMIGYGVSRRRRS